MLTEVKNLIRFLIESIKCNLKSAVEYKKSFFVQMILMVVNNGFFLIFWQVVFNVNGGHVDGITMKDVLYLWAIPPASWGLANFLFGGFREINRYVINGQLDTYFIQPKSMLLSVGVSKTDYGACGDLVYGIVLGIIACSSIGEFFMMIYYILMGTILTASAFIIIRSLSFYLGEIDQIAHVYENSLFITLSSYPMNIFSDFFKFLMYTVIPVAYLTHIPIKLIYAFDIKSFILIGIVSIGFFVFANVFFNKSLKRYESGNSMLMRN